MFNAKLVKEKMIIWIKEYMKDSKGKGVVIGISGGKDSTVVASLLVEALGKDNVMGVLMPNGVQKDISDSYKVVKHLGINYTVVNIHSAYTEIIDAIKIGKELSNQSKINISPRLRMTVLYAISSSLGYRVAGTGNKSEHLVGYSTKWGDTGVDFNLLADLTTDEVIALGDELDLPYDLVHKIPADGLGDKTDEETLGISYESINKYIKDGTSGDKEIDKKIEKLYEYNRHKYIEVPMFVNELP